MTADRIRNGWRPTLAEKIATCETLEELDGMLAQIRIDGRTLNPIEARAAQELRAKMIEEGKGR